MGWTSQVVIAQQVIIEGTAAGLFVYDAGGNLIASIAAAPGTDQSGHSYNAVASFGDQAGAYVNIDASGDISVTNAASKVVLMILAAIGAMLTYSATAGAGAGNLEMAYSPLADSDGFGNAFPAGYTAFGPGGGYVNLQEGQLSFQGTSSQFAPAIIQTQELAGLLDLTSGQVTSGDTEAEVFLESAGASGGSGSTISLTAANILANGNDLARIFGILDPSGYPLSGSATLAAVIATVNSIVQRLQAVGIFQ